MKKTRWLDRRIAHPGPFLALCLNNAEFQSACKHLSVKTPDSWITNEWSDATAHYFECKSGLAVIVCITNCQKFTPIEIAGLLIHEAVHVWQEYAHRIGEHAPGREQEAYAIQSISQELLQEYANRMAGI